MSIGELMTEIISVVGFKGLIEKFDKEGLSKEEIDAIRLYSILKQKHMKQMMKDSIDTQKEWLTIVRYLNHMRIDL